MEIKEAYDFAVEMERDAKNLDSNLLKFPVARVTGFLRLVSPDQAKQMTRVIRESPSGMFRFSGFTRMLDYCLQPYTIQYDNHPELSFYDSLDVLYRCTSRFEARADIFPDLLDLLLQIAFADDVAGFVPGDLPAHNDPMPAIA